MITEREIILFSNVSTSQYCHEHRSWISDGWWNVFLCYLYLVLIFVQFIQLSIMQDAISDCKNFINMQLKISSDYEQNQWNRILGKCVMISSQEDSWVNRQFFLISYFKYCKGRTRILLVSWKVYWSCHSFFNFSTI